MRAAFLLFASVCACSSPSFELGAAEDSGAAVNDTRLDEDAPPREVSGCGGAGDATEVWVDTAATTKPTGERACPFAHVADAADYLATLTARARTIRVVAGSYREDRAVRLPKLTTLMGDGPESTTITGGGACNPGGVFNCVVRVDVGAVIQDVQITGASSEDAAGILAIGGSVVGPRVWALRNRQGLLTALPGDVKVAGTGNRFDENTSLGIFHAGSGALIFEGGTANKNAVGVRIGSSVSGAPPISRLTNLVAEGNTVGLRITGDGSVRLRKSTFIGNRFGVIAIYGLFNELDFGLNDEHGGNSFGNAATKNEAVAVCLQNARARLPLVGNFWPSCSLTLASTTNNCDDLAVSITYKDVLYKGTYTPDAANCTASP